MATGQQFGGFTPEDEARILEILGLAPQTSHIQGAAPSAGVENGLGPVGQDAGLLTTEEMQAARDRFMETPGYQFRFDEGLRALDRSASARGRLLGGGYGRELTRYGQGVASAEFENYANRLASLALMGQRATTASATLGAGAAGNIASTRMAGAAGEANMLMGAGTARASGYAGAANAASGGVSNYLLYNLLQRGGFPWGGGMAGMT